MSTRVVAVFSLVLLLFPVASLAAWQDDGNPVCIESNSQQSPSAIPDGAGGAFIVWTDARTFQNDIYAQRIDAHGNAMWAPNGVALCTLISDQNAPVLIADGAGGIIVAWHDWRNQMTMSQDLYAQRLNGAGVAQWTANGVVLVSTNGGQHFPKLLPSGVGGVLAVWYDERNGNPNADIYGGRLNASGATVDTPLGFVVSNAAQMQTPSSVIPYDNGGAIVSFIDTRLGTPNIYAARISNLGVVLDPAGIPICVELGDQLYPATVSDGAGGAIIAWSDVSRNGEIFAQRINSSGAVQWAANGVDVGNVSLLSSISHMPQMVSDGAGGAILSWFRFDASDRNVYAQRINSSGAKQWPASSLPVCTAATNQDYLDIVSDNAGGAVIGWSDPRHNTFGGDVFAQRVLPDGTLAWFPNGVTVCDVAGNQYELSMVSDETGGAIFAWTDRREFNQTDVYAHRLAAEGQTPTSVGNAPTVATLGQNYPNPFNPSTSIPFRLTRAGDVTLRIYDVSGTHVATLLNERREAGEHVVRWDGRTAAGAIAPTGIYFVQLSANGVTETRKLALLK